MVLIIVNGRSGSGKSVVLRALRRYGFLLYQQSARYFSAKISKYTC